jgi:hypothetical protein
MKFVMSSEVYGYRSRGFAKRRVRSFSLHGVSLFGNVSVIDRYEVSQTVASLGVIDIVFQPHFSIPVFAHSGRGRVCENEMTIPKK